MKPLSDQILAFLSAMKRESDRAAAVLAAAFVEELLVRVMMGRLTVPGVDGLFGPEGALGTFSRRITMARALGWIHEDTHHDLNVLRKVRNSFAHDYEHDLSFATPHVRDRTRTLRVLVAMEAEVKRVADLLPRTDEAAAAVKLTKANLREPRALFEMAVMMLIAAIAEGARPAGDGVAPAPSAAALAAKQVTAMIAEPAT